MPAAVYEAFQEGPEEAGGWDVVIDKDATIHSGRNVALWEGRRN